MNNSSDNVVGRKYLLIIIACSCLAIASLGIIINVNGIFFAPVSKSLGVGVGSVSLCATLTALMTGFASPVIIKLLTKTGLKKLLFICMTITAASTILMGYVSNIIIYNVLGVIRGASSAGFGIPIITLIMGNWFIKRRGLFMGIVMSCSGAAGAILSPVLARIIEIYGYKMGYVICGILIIVFTFPAAAILTETPGQVGMKMYGEMGWGAKNENDISVSKTEKSLQEQNKIQFTYGNRIFLLLIVMAFLCQSVCSFAQHLSGYAVSLNMSAGTGAMMISAAMVGNIVAKALLGEICDKIGAVKGAVIIISTFLTGLVILLIFGNSAIMLMIGALLLGTSYSGALLFSIFIFEIFDKKSYGKAYSMLTIVLNTGGALAISGIGYMYDILDTYKISLGIGIVMVIIAIIMLLIIQSQVCKKKYI